jgi:vacuolar iron transporter family protein
MRHHREVHRLGSVGWLRAAILGANDGLISTSSLVVGMAAASATREPILAAGAAGLVAGALSMAAGEYVSVSSQSDTEGADLARERSELQANPDAEHAELAAIYVARGLEPGLARQVAQQLMSHDALGAHARDELGISDVSQARPMQAALTSAAAFAAGATPPVLASWLLPLSALGPTLTAGTLMLLAGLGAVAARLGGAPVARGAARVCFWGAAAMVAAWAVGRLFGAAV